MVSSNQRSIYEGLNKVIGSSNRGFASIDPERQPGGVPQGSKQPASTKAVPATGTTVAGGAQRTTRG